MCFDVSFKTHTCEARRKDAYLRFCISLSAFLMNSVFLDRLIGASTAMSIGLRSANLLTISLSLNRLLAETNLLFSVAPPLG